MSKRDAYSKTYALADGTYQYISYAEPIHYKDSSGAYIEINNAITNSVKLAGYKYTNTSNGWNAHFAEKLSNDNAVTLTSGKYTVAFSYGAQTSADTVMKTTAMPSVSARSTVLSAYHKKLSSDNRAVIYRDVAENVDIAYTVQAGALKEDIILNSKQAPSMYKFRLTTNGLTIMEGNDKISLHTATGEEVFTFAPLYMEDANGKRSDSVSLTYISVKNGYELTVSADTEFLNAADTAYPVVIDPSIMVTGSSSTYDTCVDQQYPSSNYYLSESLWTGGAYGTNAMRTYMNFYYPLNIKPFQITSAYIYLLKKDYQTPYIRAYAVTGNWSSSSLTWNNQPTYNSSLCSAVAINTNGNWYGLDVTEIVKGWIGGTIPEYGIVLKEPNENSSSQKTKFYSSDAPSPNKPELVINYEPYYGSRPYQETSRPDVNCMGYALQLPRTVYLNLASVPNYDPEIDPEPMHLDINLADLYGKTLDELEAFFAEKSEKLMSKTIGAANWRYLADYHSPIDQNWYRVVLRVGIRDLDKDGVLDVNEDYDFHWWYQTNTGYWAEKHGSAISEYPCGDPDISPVEFEWPVLDYFYTSSGVFYQIRDIPYSDW